MTNLTFDYTNTPYHFDQDLKIGQKVNFFIKHLPAAFTSCQNNDYFFYLAQKIADWQGFETIVVIGMGGSSLGAQTLCQMASNNPKIPTILFADNTDSARFILPKLNLATTAVLVISKSGGTSEVLCNAKQFINAYKRSNLDVTKHVTGITEENPSELRSLLTNLDIHIIPHHKEIGGRYSVLSIVGLLPAALAGIDTQKLMAGAQKSLQQFYTKPLTNAAYHGALFSGLTKKPNHVIMPYGTGLNVFGRWYSQLWAESLGKDGKGTTPIAAIGATDQHATLQLYLDGSAHNIFTIIAPKLEAQVDEDMKLLAAQALATADSLKAKGHDVRLITFDTLTEDVMGELLMHFMLETILTSFIWQVNPYDQPAVEDGKNRAREYLAQHA
jgi:glucose-6-phosphate isomerase